MEYAILGGHVPPEQYGSKAYWINWLYENRYKVPNTLFIPHSVENEVFEKKMQFILKSSNFNTCKLAIRSSSTVEDSLKESNAGIFMSFLGEMSYSDIVENYYKVKESQFKVPNSKMGVIIQELVDAVISGVIFSSDPSTCSKKKVLISYISGLADNLVSGKVNSTDITINLDSDFTDLDDDNDKYTEVFKSLISQVKKIEETLNFPVNVEWAINNDNEIILLQCRPIAGFLLDNNSVKLISNNSMKDIPLALISSDKINLRQICEINNIFISQAYLITANCGVKNDLNIDLEIIKRSEFCVGYSVVMLSPKLINKKVMRAFVGCKEKSNIISRDYKAEVINTSNYKDITVCICDFIEKVENDYWVCSIIVQEIFNSIYTGIINKIDECFILELTKGHFATKGIVPMSKYIIENNNIIYSNEISQNEFISIFEGKTYKCTSNDFNDNIVRLSKQEIIEIKNYFNSIYDRFQIIEFGLLEINNNYVPYVIDNMRNSSMINVLKDSKGIIFAGKISGKIFLLDSENKDSCDLHFFDEIESNSYYSEKLVFVAKLPDISYVRILSLFLSENISFIFEAGSTLCHLAILLRERNIPSFIGYDISNLQNGDIIELQL